MLKLNYCFLDGGLGVNRVISAVRLPVPPEKTRHLPPSGDGGGAMGIEGVMGEFTVVVFCSIGFENSLSINYSS